MRRSVPILLSALILSGCMRLDGSHAYEPVLTAPEGWTTTGAVNVAVAQPDALKNWWNNFNDPVLSQLVADGVADSPDRAAAEARIIEARGQRKTAFSTLLPEIGASASGGRGESGGRAGNFYDAGFDASYEIDIFGANRNSASAAENNILALEAEYENVTLTLIGDIAANYITYKGAQKQAAISRSNIVTQEKSLELVRQLFDAGEIARLDVERAENLLNSTKASVPEYERQAENAALALGVLTGKMPASVGEILGNGPAVIPGAQVDPVLLAPAQVLAQRPDIRAAIHGLAQASDLTDAAVADIFPTFTLDGMYGIAKTALLSSTNVWSVAGGAAVSLLNFGRVQGQIDAAKGREKQAFEAYRKTVLSGVSDVEGALNDYAKNNERRVSLLKAHENARSALQLSETLFKEGEISFLEVLDAQRSANDTEASLSATEMAQSLALVRLYKSLGVGF